MAVVRGGDSPSRGGEDDLDDRHGVSLTGVTQHGGAGGVARDDECLDAAVDEVVETLERVLAHLTDRLGTVRLTRSVTEVEDRLVGQLVENCAHYSQPAEAGVEDADRCVCHGWQRTTIGSSGRNQASSKGSVGCGGACVGSTPSNSELTDSPA